jgi:hypothetical protein
MQDIFYFHPPAYSALDLILYFYIKKFYEMYHAMQWNDIQRNDT